ncbi:GNAT family N-acetyltransferase [Thiomicrorhabdus sp. Milos-T2]|uniref:GNAT family N-acetyltransferase n=1 Tax=Thiomicrorhabdus sp. Milos-T2 TaxID=90814 RepID=UPI000493ED8F|nr:GNAT family N-acetyltransferase [Thiomicrorhabdus sp. Milos-T2]
MNTVMQNNLNFDIATNEQFYEIKHFLKQNQTYSANRSDKIYTVRNNHKLIGLARLLSLDDCVKTFWLRGLFIESGSRNQGIASALLTYIRKNETQLAEITSIVAFAEPHLQAFYANNRYQEVSVNHIPNSLQDRFNNAQNQGKNWLCLKTKI